MILDLPSPLSVEDQRLVGLYNDLGSIWKVGKELGVCGQTVANHLARLGIDLSPPEFTPDQIRKIKNYYTATPDDLFDLSELAAVIGKSRQNIARLARKMGLTDQRRRHSLANREKQKRITEQLWKEQPHPRGMAGKRHGDAAKGKMSLGQKRTWATQKTFGGPLVSEERSEQTSARMRLLAATRSAESVFTRAKGGRRADLENVYFRSSWEANYARYLNLLMKLGVVEHWDFEPEVFWFPGIRRGVTNYKPDFRIKYKGDDRLEYVEIKGWVVAKDKVKWRRMKKYHPGIKLMIVKKGGYLAIKKKWAASIPNWE